MQTFDAEFAIRKVKGCHELCISWGDGDMLSSVPAPAGIGYSDDKLLQTRIFSYSDTQRHR
jgi:hypothetical protein